MGLLDMFKKPEPAKKVTEYHFTTAKHFRGFHKFLMTVYGDQEAMKNQEKFRDRDTTGLPIVFRDYGEGAAVILDGLKIGTIYREQLQTLRSGAITDVYVKFEDADGVFRAHLIVKEK
jgi:hypothetical protein